MGRLVQRLQISAVINCIYTAIMTGTCTRDTLQKTNAMNTKRSCFIDMHHLLTLSMWTFDLCDGIVDNRCCSMQVFDVARHKTEKKKTIQ